MELDDLRTHRDALERYNRSRLHFVDCMIAATAAKLGLHVATFDHDFKKFADVTIDLE